MGMRAPAKGLVSFVASGCTWLLDRRYGDEVFRAFRPVIPSRVTDAALDDALTFGPPVLLLLVGCYFFLRAAGCKQGVEGKLRFIDVFPQAQELVGLERGAIYVDMVKIGILLDSASDRPLRIEVVGAAELDGRISQIGPRPLLGEVQPGIPLAAIWHGIRFDPPAPVRVGDLYLGHLEFRVRYGLGRRLKHTLGPYRLFIGLCVDPNQPRMLRLQWQFDPDHNARLLGRA
jgi:hypothetical protein